MGTKRRILEEIAFNDFIEHYIDLQRCYQIMVENKYAKLSAKEYRYWKERARLRVKRRARG